MHGQLLLLGDHTDQFVERDIALGTDLRTHPIRVRRQFAKAGVTLLFGAQSPGYTFQFDHVVDKFDRNIEPTRRRCVRISSFNMRNNTLLKLKWMWFSHSDRPC